jgi:uncharacterized protein
LIVTQSSKIQTDPLDTRCVNQQNPNACPLEYAGWVQGARQSAAATPQRVGLISDTHGLLRPEAIHALTGSELILHAGDVGKPEILEALRKLAPVTAIRGNVDTEPWAAQLPETTEAQAGSVKFYLLHNVNDLDLEPGAAGFHIVLSGHSHQPGKTERRGVWYINPGSAGPRRFSLPVSVARLDLSKKPWALEFVDLEASRVSPWAKR